MEGGNYSCALSLIIYGTINGVTYLTIRGEFDVPV